MDGLKRNENGTFAEGTAPGPGRPKGKSLKEFWRERFENMTDDEKLDFAAKVAPDLLWKMAEGNPQNDVMSGGEKIAVNLVNFDENNNGTAQSTADKE